MTTTTKTLTVPQFIAAKALASTYHHLWAGAIGDNFMLDVKEIDDLVSESQDIQFGGITSPTLDEEGSVVHVTGTGRLSWWINSAGNVELNIYRPANTCRTWPLREDGIAVARVVTINDNDNDWSWQDDVTIFTSHRAMMEFDDSVDYDPNVCSDLLFERHVQALVEPLVSLILAKQEEGKTLAAIVEDGEIEYQRWQTLTEEEQIQEREVSHQRYLKHKQEVIDPATAKAETYLKPLFDIALPDSWYDNDREKPETYWIQGKDPRWQPYPEYEVHPMHQTVYHHGEAFPVETELVAARTVKLLRQVPEMELIEAIKTTIATR